MIEFETDRVADDNLFDKLENIAGTPKTTLKPKVIHPMKGVQANKIVVQDKKKCCCVTELNQDDSITQNIFPLSLFHLLSISFYHIYLMNFLLDLIPFK